MAWDKFLFKTHAENEVGTLVPDLMLCGIYLPSVVYNFVMIAK